MSARPLDLDPIYLFGCYLAALRAADPFALAELYDASVHPCAETRVVAAALLEELGTNDIPARGQESTSWIMLSR
jgi:hypothetical protein